MQPEQQGNWVYKGASEQPQAIQDQPNTPNNQLAQPVTWTASEFIAHHKSASWYLTLVGGIVVGGGLIYVLTRDLVSVIFITIAIILFIIIGARKPQQRTYSVDNRGVTIGNKLYDYNSFKSFAVVNEGAFNSIVFMPLQRFMPELTIYYAPEDEGRIINMIASNLPNDQRKEKAVDQLMKRIRF